MRTVPEWIGKTDNSMPPDRVKDRIRERQGNQCALTEVPFGPRVKPQFDHIVPLWLGGQNRESNLQAITEEAHKKKTATEATVRAKCNRTRMKHFGIKKSKAPFGNPNFKRRMDGTVVDRRTGEIVR